METELEQLISERNYHNERHIELKEELLQLAKGEFDIEALQDELHHSRSNQSILEETIKCYQIQIDELNKLIEVPDYQKKLQNENQKKLQEEENKKDQENKDNIYYIERINKLEKEFYEIQKDNERLKREARMNEKIDYYVRGENEEAKREHNQQFYQLEQQNYREKYEDLMEEAMKMQAKISTFESRLEHEGVKDIYQDQALEDLASHEFKVLDKLRKLQHDYDKILQENFQLENTLKDKNQRLKQIGVLERENVLQKQEIETLKSAMKGQGMKEIEYWKNQNTDLKHEISDILDNTVEAQQARMTSMGQGPRPMVTHSNNQVLKSEKQSQNFGEISHLKPQNMNMKILSVDQNPRDSIQSGNKAIPESQLEEENMMLQKQMMNLVQENADIRKHYEAQFALLQQNGGNLAALNMHGNNNNNRMSVQNTPEVIKEKDEFISQLKLQVKKIYFF